MVKSFEEIYVIAYTRERGYLADGKFMQMMRLSSGPNNTFFPQKEVVKSIGNPAGIGKGTGLGLRERDRDGIGLGHYRLRTIPNSVSKGFDTAMKTGSSRRFKRYPTT